jgi:translation initiation factor 2B subunit (eIF-2B alpha/beta/delta family)
MLLMRALEEGIDFTVIVVDSRPKFEGILEFM